MSRFSSRPNASLFGHRRRPHARDSTRASRLLFFPQARERLLLVGRQLLGVMSLSCASAAGGALLESGSKAPGTTGEIKETLPTLAPVVLAACLGILLLLLILLCPQFGW
ncbi:hypothetical protein CCMA1212_007771 [Trichoderma ghanense]|uniref:Uncharacterized protein n=1 Tax=Trichoderma ghanense TaxID=65468 RepID=A0ABY2GWP6_9HYPO